MTNLNVELGTCGAIVAQRAMIDYEALDLMADPHRAYPDGLSMPDEPTVKRRLDALVSQLSVAAHSKSVESAADIVHISARGGAIACCACETRADGSMVIGPGPIALAKIVRECVDEPAFDGKAGDIMRNLVGNIPKPDHPSLRHPTR